MGHQWRLPTNDLDYGRAMSSGYDPVLAARSVRELAAVTDEQLIDEVRAATTVVVNQVEQLRRSGWPRDSVEEAADTAVKTAQAVLVDLPANASLSAVVAAVRPLLGQWWPDRPAEAAAVAAAVERLRHAALHRPAQVRDARWLSTS
jgi:hypothetical protein